MKLSVKRLNSLLQKEFTPDELSDILTATGLEVEGIEAFSLVEGGLEGVVTGKVLSVEKHPDADRLSVCRVDTGEAESRQIVCGAPNVAPGQFVLVALPGAVLYPEGASSPLEIKPAKIRGVASSGMICAEDELGLGNSHDGIMVLEQPVQPGRPAAELFDLGTDTLLEVNITPNRPDATCHVGAARDVAAWLSCREIVHGFSEPDVPVLAVDSHADDINVDIQATAACGRYAGLTIRGLENKESPGWLQNALTSLGISPQNCVVDAVNYTMTAYGLPMHAFDADALGGSEIHVRFARSGETLETLDGQQRELHEGDLLIAGSTGPLCLAGVYGGRHSGVQLHTTSVFLEAAWFNPSVIRKTARRHGIHSDSSFRFERGVDTEIQPLAILNAAALIQQLCGGALSGYLDHKTADLPAPVTVEFHPSYFSSLAGMDISYASARKILVELGFSVEENDVQDWMIRVPGNKPDVTLPADVAEEVIRIIGFDAIPPAGAIRASIPRGGKVSEQPLMRQTRTLLSGAGLREVICLSMISRQEGARFPGGESEHLVELANPLSRDGEVLRPSLFPSMMQVMARNIKHGNKDLHLFELGKVYRRNGTGESPFAESLRLCFGFTGLAMPQQWGLPMVKSGLFHIKGVLTHWCKGMRLPAPQIVCLEDRSGWEVRLVSEAVGRIIFPDATVRKAYDCKQEVWLAELEWEQVRKHLPEDPLQFKEWPIFPGIRRDLALLVKEGTSFGELETLIRSVGKKKLVSLELFDIYKGKGIAEGMASYALSLYFLDSAGTLREEEVEAMTQKMLQRLESEMGATLRK